MIGKNRFDVRVQQEIVNLLSCDLKKGQKMEASGVNTPLHDNTFISKFFLERNVSKA